MIHILCPTRAAEQFGKCLYVEASKMTPLYGMRSEKRAAIGGIHFAKQNSETSVAPHFRPILATKKFAKCFLFLGVAKMPPRCGMWFGTGVKMGGTRFAKQNSETRPVPHFSPNFGYGGL